MNRDVLVFKLDVHLKLKNKKLMAIADENKFLSEIQWKSGKFR